MMKDLQFASIEELHAALHRGEISLVEIVAAHCQVILSLNPTLNALAVDASERARATAPDMEGARLHGPTTPPGPLLGATCVIKDSIDVEGLTRSDGSLNTPPTVSPRSTDLVQRLLAAGAICIGKGNMAEYGKSYFTENPRYGRTENPFRQGYSPGGSGGGDAVAVATGMATFGLGIDSGGSIRVPAAFCGIFGLYPAPGELPDRGATLPPSAVGLMLRSVGPLARSIQDLKAVYAVLADGVSKTSDRGVNRRAFAWYGEITGNRAHPEILAALEDVVGALKGLGYKGSRGAPACVERSLEPFIILAGQASLLLEDALAVQRGTPRDPAKEGPLVQILRQRIAQFLPPLSAERVLLMWHECTLLRRMAEELWEEFSFMVAPVAATLPPPYGAGPYQIEGQTLQSEQVFQFASSVNLLGLSAVAFPVKMSNTGLPIGLQLIGPPGSESRLMEIVKELGFVEALRPL